MKTRVLIVGDSIFFRRFLTEKLSAFSNIEIAGYATNALEAKYAIPNIKPDVVTLDIEMPGISGIELLKIIMVDNPIPVVLVSAVNINVFDALSAGAVDFVRKPDAADHGAVPKFIQELAEKIDIAKNARPKKAKASKGAAPPKTASQKKPPATLPAAAGRDAKANIIAIGASTGGTEATLRVLKDLPEDMPGMVIVQHMPPGFTKMYADRLDAQCRINIREAKDGDRVEQGTALIAPGDMQMRLVRIGTQYSVNCFYGEKVNGHAPSVDVLFHSVAQTAGRDAVGIIMTGMGKDGAEGLLRMKQKGAFTIGQDEESCVVYGMPMAAYNMGAVMRQAPCDNIPHVLKAYLSDI